MVTTHCLNIGATPQRGLVMVTIHCLNLGATLQWGSRLTVVAVHQTPSIGHNRDTLFIPDVFTLDSSLGIHEDAIKRQSSFVEIFQERHWGDGKSDPEELSASGLGSSLAITSLVRQTLDCVINDIKYALNKKVLRLLDIPCGDLRWMSVFLTNRTDIEYTGMYLTL